MMGPRGGVASSSRTTSGGPSSTLRSAQHSGAAHTRRSQGASHLSSYSSSWPLVAGTAAPCPSARLAPCRARPQKAPQPPKAPPPPPPSKKTQQQLRQEQQHQQQNKLQTEEDPDEEGAEDDGDAEELFDEGEEDEEEEGEEEGEDGFVGDDEFEDDGPDEEVDAELLAAMSGEDGDTAREFVTGGTRWGDAALAASHRLLLRPEFETLDIYLLRADTATRRIDLRLERMDDVYGSPSIDDIERFSRALRAELEVDLGLEEAGNVAIEASSPGAERLIRFPEDLHRFVGLPLKVEHYGDGGSVIKRAVAKKAYGRAGAGGIKLSAPDAAPAEAPPSPAASSSPSAGEALAAAVAVVAPSGPITTTILELVSFDDAGTQWRMADVRINAKVKGRGLSRKQRDKLYSFSMADIVRARIFVDF